MKFIHLADCHLASNNLFDEDMSSIIRKNTWDSFRNIFSSNKDVDFALIAGDLFERKFMMAGDFEKIFDVFDQFNKDIYYVTGNHDYFDSYNEIFLNNKPNNLHIFTDNKISFFEKDDTRIYGISYTDRINSYDFPYDMTLDKNYFNILLAHADISQNPTNYLDLDPYRLEDIGFDYVALGHIHKKSNIRNSYYPSSIEPHSFNDLGEFGYIRYENGKINQISSSLMKFISLDIDTDDFMSYEEIIDSINNKLTNKINFLRLNISGDDIDETLLKSKIKASHIEIIRKRSRNYKDLIKLYPDSLLSHFIENIDPDNDINEKALAYGVDAILRSLR